MSVNNPQRSALAYEAQVNGTYLAWLEGRAKDNPLLPQHRLGERRTPGGRIVDPDTMCLVGRVELDHLDDVIGHRDFYIGPTHRSDDGRSVVFSWVAPVAAAFFGNGRHELSSTVRVRRTLVARRSSITDVVDEWAVPQDGEPFPSGEAGGLVVPQAPARPRRRIAAGSAPAAMPSPTRPPRPVVAELAPPPKPAVIAPALEGEPEPAAAQVISTNSGVFASMRACGAVLAALQAPRTERLTSVLATLQPDQYDLVTRPADQPLVVQGHPGTGKTVIAVHRAAYLVHPERQGAALGRLLLLGPTEGYVHHVRGLLDGLDASNRVSVQSLETCLKAVAGIDGELDSSRQPSLHDTLWQTGRLIRDAVRWARTGGFLAHGGRQNDVAGVWDMLRQYAARPFPLTSDAEIRDWASNLPSFGVAARQRRYLPLMAAIALATAPFGDRETFPHIIVDEAQDLTPIEWMIVSKLNSRNRWTIVGDMNQRRSDRCYPSWKGLARDLLADVAPETFAPEIFDRGYRSTAEILAFANKLLPRGERTVLSLQQGGLVPEVIKTPADSMGNAALICIQSMLDRHREGTAAIITTNPMNVLKAIRHSTGWEKVSNDRQLWKLDTVKVLVVTPDQARGLEFDVVVVMEPSDFPQNIGQQGQLYTSLTRANRELAVVHSRPLPSELRRAGRKAIERTLSA